MIFGSESPGFGSYLDTSFPIVHSGQHHFPFLLRLQGAHAPIRREVNVHFGAATVNVLRVVKEARSGTLLVRRTRPRAADMLKLCVEVRNVVERRVVVELLLCSHGQQQERN